MRQSNATTALAALAELIETTRGYFGERPLAIGISGAQGSGKTTLREAFCAAYPGAVGFSLDDVYLPRAEREKLARDIHPLLITRGPPGTHDLALLRRTGDALLAGERTKLPAFDKRTDDRAPKSTWRMSEGGARLILIDGWCIGAAAQRESELAEPINDLEACEDRNGVWRRFVNDQLAGPYNAAWHWFDAILYLDAPSFDVVLAWRTQQEEDLLGRALNAEEAARMERFVSHFERVTCEVLEGGRHITASAVAFLDEQRQDTSVFPDGPCR